MECSRKHHNAYVERLRKKQYSQSARIDVGSIVHLGLEVAFKQFHARNYDRDYDSYLDVQLAIDKYSDENAPEYKSSGEEGGFSWDNQAEIDAWKDTVKLASAIAHRTIKHLDIANNWRVQTIQWNGVETPLIEFKFEYPLVEDRNMVGKIDLVAKSLTDEQVYLIDWKTRKTMVEPFSINGEDMNLQMSIYQYVLNSLGVNIFGTLTYQIRSDIPHQPEITQQGKVSKANITTDWNTYRQALIDNGQDPADPAYNDVATKLLAQGDDYWFAPVLVIRARIELQSRWDTIQIIAGRMVKDTEAPKYESQRCTFCPYFDLCLGEDRGLDVDFLKENEYTKDTEGSILPELKGN